MIQWAAFVFLGCIAWGTSFLWIKVALRELGPLTLVTYRVLFGVATILTTVLLTRRRIVWKGIRFWVPVLFGVLGTAIPISLISWAELRIDSGIAGILNGTMPIWTILIAHFVLHDDRFTKAKIAGILIGFAGMYLLLHPEIGVERDVIGQLAVVMAAVLYASTIVLARHYLKGVHPLQTTVPSLLAAAVTMLVLSTSLEAPLALPRQPMTWLACAWMGIIGMGLAQQVWFWLLNHWTASRVSMVTYAFPLTAVALGVIFLGERLTWDLVAGSALIIGGIALVNRPVNHQPTTTVQT